MTGRRKRRYAKLHDADRQAIEAAATKLLDAMRNAKMNLIAFNEHYTALARARRRQARDPQRHQRPPARPRAPERQPGRSPGRAQSPISGSEPCRSVAQNASRAPGAVRTHAAPRLCRLVACN